MERLENTWWLVVISDSSEVCYMDKKIFFLPGQTEGKQVLQIWYLSQGCALDLLGQKKMGGFFGFFAINYKRKSCERADACGDREGFFELARLQICFSSRVTLFTANARHCHIALPCRFQRRLQLVTRDNPGCHQEDGRGLLFLPSAILGKCY